VKASEPTALMRALPNWLTASRVLMAIVFFGVLTVWRYEDSAASRHQTDWLLIISAALFIIAGLTDVVDGYLARRWNVESAFGRIMDPFADKILVVGAFVFLAGPDFWWEFTDKHKVTLAGHGVQLSGVYPWMVVVILGRELLVTSIRGALESMGVKFPADVFGKVKMFLQSVAVPTALIAVAITDVLPHESGSYWSNPWGRITIDFTIWGMVIATILSGVPYVIRCVRLLAEWQKAKRQAV
jgi:CDP-diacylglycerol--glycerol-3-phosphate 3-phosphatidyltransferase